MVFLPMEGGQHHLPIQDLDMRHEMFPRPATVRRRMACAVLFLPSMAFAQAAAPAPSSDPPAKLSINPLDHVHSAGSADLTSMSIEDLMNVEVISSARRKQ